MRPLLTVEALNDRVRRAPIAHLGERAPRTLLAYQLGYATGAAHHAAGPLIDDLGERLREAAEARLARDEPDGPRWSPGSFVGPETYALLRSADEVEALDRYFELHDEVLAEPAAAGAARPIRGVGAGEPLIHYLEIRGREGWCWFGTPAVSGFWAFANGFAWAERDLQRSSSDVTRMRAFQAWVDERYPFGRGGTWARTFRFLALSVPQRECDMFQNDLGSFLRGAAPDDD